MNEDESRPSIAVIVLDTLRKDTFDRHFGWFTGRSFENAWSTSHWTVPAHASLFTGEYGSDVGTYARSHTFDCEGRVLVEHLSDAGYRTRGFSANPHITPRYGFDRGFDEFECVGNAVAHGDRVPSRDDYFTGPGYKRPLQLALAGWHMARGEYDTRATATRAYQRLYERYPLLPSRNPGAGKALSYVRDLEFDDPEFLFLNLMDVHSPYKPPVTYQSHRYSAADLEPDLMATFTGEEVDGSMSREAYEDCARYLSDVTRKIVDELRGFDYVVLLSDHGESFGENGVWAHRVGLHPEITQIPLVIRGLEREERTVRAPVNLLDLFMTIADIAGLDVGSAGRSLLADLEPRPCLTEYHGILYEQMIQRIRDQSVPEERIQEFDEPRFGVALPPDYYGYESINGFSSRGHSEERSPRAVLEALKAERPPIERDKDTLDGELEGQLRQLGYL